MNEITAHQWTVSENTFGNLHKIPINTLAVFRMSSLFQVMYDFVCLKVLILKMWVGICYYEYKSDCSLCSAFISDSVCIKFTFNGYHVGDIKISLFAFLKRGVTNARSFNDHNMFLSFKNQCSFFILSSYFR